MSLKKSWVPPGISWTTPKETDRFTYTCLNTAFLKRLPTCIISTTSISRTTSNSRIASTTSTTSNTSLTSNTIATSITSTSITSGTL
jgi:hypothetical protein